MVINKQFLKSIIQDLNYINDEITHNDNTDNGINESYIFKDLVKICEGK